MLMIDQIYRYRSLAAQRQGYCRLRIYTRRGGHAVLLTEVANNPGQSITAASEVIATGVLTRHHLNPINTLWIEHWPADAHDTLTEDAYAAVKYTWSEGVATNPQWRSLSQEQVETSIGTPLSAASLVNSPADADTGPRRM